MEKTLCVFNQTRQSFLSLSVTRADTHLARLKGLLGKVKLKSDEGLWTIPSQGIHTLFLLFPIDLLYLDNENRVVHLIENLGTFRITPLRTDTTSVLQLRTRTIYSSNTQVGDQLLICSPENMGNYFKDYQVEQSFKLMPRLSERHPGPRLGQPGISAFYWDGSVPVPYPVRDMSRTGAYLCTHERWYVGTAIRLTLSRDDISITLWSRVIAHGSDGVEIEFIPAKHDGRKELERFINAAMERAEKNYE